MAANTAFNLGFALAFALGFTFGADPLFPDVQEHDGISYDPSIDPDNGGHVVIRVPGQPAQHGKLTDFFTFTRASNGTYRGRDGLLKTAANNVPRIEATGGVYSGATYSGYQLGLLVEANKTNIPLHSEDLSNAAYTKAQCSISANATASPDGAVSADKVVEDNTTNFHTVSQAITVAATTAYTVSFFAKAAERSWLLFDMTGGAAPGLDSAYINLASQTYGTVQASLTAHPPREWANGFYRYAFTFTTVALTDLNVIIGLATADLTGSYAGDNTSGAFVWGLQVEAGLFPSSYIPTGAASASRSAETIARTFGSEVSQTVGTMLAEFDCNAEQTTNAYNLFSINDGTTNEYLRIALFQTLGGITCRDGGVTNADNFGGSWALGVRRKLVGTYEANNINAVVGGVVLTPDTSATLPTTTQIQIGSNNGHGDRLYGHIFRLNYWPERPPNAVLQAMTT